MDPTNIDIVEEPEPGAAIEVGLKETVTPEGCPDAERETAELNPPETVVEIVEEPDDPWTTETLLGDEEIAKSGFEEVEHVEYLKFPIRVCQ